MNKCFVKTGMIEPEYSDFYGAAMDEREVWFFGSRARGDFAPDSDYDVLIVLGNGDSQVRDDVRLLAARVSLEHDVLINTHVLSRERWETLAREKAPYWQNVQTEGVPLWDKQ